jgi:hypothetical protein
MWINNAMASVFAPIKDTTAASRARAPTALRKHAIHGFSHSRPTRRYVVDRPASVNEDGTALATPRAVHDQRSWYPTRQKTDDAA